MDKPIDEICIGDRVYIRRDCRHLLTGDIIQVTGIDDRTQHLYSGVHGYRIRIHPNCKPIRVLVPGDVVPAGSRVLRIPAYGDPCESGWRSDITIGYHNSLTAIISLPEDSKTRELRELREQYEILGDRITALDGGCA